MATFLPTSQQTQDTTGKSVTNSVSKSSSNVTSSQQTNQQTNSSSTGGNKTVQGATGQVSQNTQQNFNNYNKNYQQSDNVASAYQKLQANLGQGQTYQDNINNIYNKITNGDKFNFDVNQSVLYNQLKDQYTALGQLAMQDTMGQVAGMTGGYASSYAQTAGQQQYQNYMQQLNEQLPSLYQMELDRYNADRADLYNQFGAANTIYGNWQNDRNFDQSAYEDERNFDYNQYAADRDYWNREYWNERNAEQTSTGNSWENALQNMYATEYGTQNAYEESAQSSATDTTQSSVSQSGSVIPDYYGYGRLGTTAGATKSTGTPQTAYVNLPNNALDAEKYLKKYYG